MQIASWRRRRSARQAPWQFLGWGAAIVLVAIAAAVLGVVLAGGELRAAVLLPGAMLAAAVLGVLVFARFETFLLVLLATRASLDILAGGQSQVIDPAGFLSLLFIVAGSAWLLTRPRSLKAPRTPLALPLLALTVAGGLSLLGSKELLAAAQDVVRFATLVLITLVLNQLLIDERRLKQLLIAMFASAIVPIAVGAYQAVTGTGLHVSGHFSRVQATFDHPNPFAMYLVTLILTAVALFPFVRRQTRLALTAFLVPAGAMLVLTYTRSAWISLVAGVLVIGLIHRKRVLAVAGIAVILVVLTVPSIAGRFQDLETSTRSSGTAANSLVWRLGYWDQALQLSHNPFIGEGLRTVAASTDVAKEPHNDFIRVYVEMGLVGMAAYLWLLGTMVRVAARGLRTATAGIHRGIVVAFTAMLSAFLLLSLVSNVITQLVVLWYVAALAAAALAAQRLHTHALAPAFAPLPSPIENPPRQ